MINCGLKGIEVYHSSHTSDETKFYLEIANKFDLLISGGSDFHGKTVKPDIELGSGKNNNIKIGIITVNENAAQQVCDLMLKNNIKAIWNFTPKKLNVPKDVLVQQENLALSLAHLNNQLVNQN